MFPPMFPRPMNPMLSMALSPVSREVNSCIADCHPDCEDDRPTEGHHDQRGAHGDLEEPVSHPGDHDQLDGDDDAGHDERPVHVADDERKRAEDSAERGGGAGDRSAYDARTSTGLLAGVRE